jgi:Domain of unknown function (DUF4843)
MNINRIIRISGLAAILFAGGCTKNELIPFTQPASVYFGKPTVFGTAQTSMDYSFAKYPSRTVDTLKLPVSLLGDASPADRVINVVVADTSIANATNGVEFKLIPPYKMPANAYSTTIPVVVYRTGAMDSLAYTFVLKLAATSELGVGIAAQSQYRIRLAYLQKPESWDRYANSEGWAKYAANLGTWTRTKYKVVLEALHNPVSDTTITEFPFSRFQPPAIYTQYLQIIRNYILTKYPGNYSNPIGIGATLRDPDANNAVIQVGPANY